MKELIQWSQFKYHIYKNVIKFKYEALRKQFASKIRPKRIGNKIVKHGLDYFQETIVGDDKA